METPASKKPLTMAELLPDLRGILTNEARQTLTGMKKKQARPTIAASQTAEKTYKPMTIAEMRANIAVLNHASPKRNMQQVNSMRKKWNSSIKVEKKTISHTDNNKMKHNNVRKVLNFPQSKPKIPVLNSASNSRMTMIQDTPKFLKPDIKVKKSMHLQVKNTVRISGICNITETPQVDKPKVNRMTIANKENVRDLPQINKLAATPKSSLHKKIMMSRIPDTPLSNYSWKSSCDDSFIQNERNIELENLTVENKVTSPKDRSHENIIEISPQVSTPFKEYRNITECFNDSSNIMDNSATSIQDNTTMWCDKTSIWNENNKREESVIVSLCDMLNKATVSQTNAEKTSTDLEDLLEVKNQTLNKLKMIETGIKTLNSLKESELRTLEYVTKLINEKQNEQTSESDKDKTLVNLLAKDDLNLDKVTPVKTPMVAKPCSVIKSCLKSPSYKIPKKMSGLKKKVHYRSMPNVEYLKMSPEKDMGERALSMYMKMKQHMNFLTTPAGKGCPVYKVMDSPTIASHNLQTQLDKLYNQS